MMQCLLARRPSSRFPGNFEYLTGWEGYGPLGDTWYKFGKVQISHQRQFHTVSSIIILDQLLLKRTGVNHTILRPQGAGGSDQTWCWGSLEFLDA